MVVGSGGVGEVYVLDDDVFAAYDVASGSSVVLEGVGDVDVVYVV